MRWRLSALRRRSHLAATPSAESSDLRSAPADVAGPAPRQRSGSAAPGTGWRSVPLLRLTVSAQHPLIAASAFRLPDLATTRPLLHRHLRRHVAAGSNEWPVAEMPVAGVPVAEAPDGRVDNLVTVVDFVAGEEPVQHVVDDRDDPVPSETPSHSSVSVNGTDGGAPASAAAAQPVEVAWPVRSLPVATTSERPPTLNADLTQATDEYVGEPQQPALAHRPSAFLRQLEAFKAPLRGEDIQPTAFPVGRPDQPLDVFDSPAAPPPSPAPRHPVVRRASLAESRRLGLDVAPAGQPPTLSTPSQADVIPDASSPVPQVGAQPTSAQSPSALTVSEPTTSQPLAPQATASMPLSELAASRALQADTTTDTAAEPVLGSRPDLAPIRPHRRFGLGPPVVSAGADDAIGQVSPADGEATPTTPSASEPTAPARPDELFNTLVTDGVGDRPLVHPKRPASEPDISVEPGMVSADPFVSTSTAPVYRAPLVALPPRSLPKVRSVKAAARLPVIAPSASYSRDRASAANPSNRPPAPEVVTAPTDVAISVGRASGVDVSDVRIHRGQSVTSRAQTLAARAFTQDGQVFVPTEVGEVSDTEVRALIAHELTHVAQHRLLGGILPDESTPEGQLLEAQAVEVAAAVRRGADVELTHVRRGPLGPVGSLSPISASTPATSRSHGGAAVAQRAPGTFFADPVEHRATTLDVIDEPAFDASLLDPGTIAEIATALEAARPDEFSEPANPQAAAFAFDVPFGDVPSYSSVSDADTSAHSVPLVPPVPADTELRDAVGNLTASLERRLVDLDDARDLDDLAHVLYPRLRHQLRHELLIDRERSGSLMDFR